MTLDKKILLIGVLVSIAICADVKEQTQAITEPPYTENLTEYKEKKHANGRAENLLACWLYLRDEPTTAAIDNNSWLHLVKLCIKNINRKQSVLKITQLGNRNEEPITPFELILNWKDELQNVNKAHEQTEFDSFLLTRSKEFSAQIEEINRKGDISSQIEKELKKREKYILGFIPASMVNQTTILITISIFLLTCMTCFKFYKKTQEKNKRKNNKTNWEDEEEHMMKRKSGKTNKNSRKKN